MKPTVKTLREILYSPSQYIIPVFQRNYRWEEPQWQKLLDSLDEIAQPNKRGNHFMGFLVFVPGLPQPGQHTTFHLIDGQQRLTTLSILLTAMRNVARDLGLDDFADEVQVDYLIHPRKSGEQHYRLLPKERDHDTYLAIIDDKGDPSGRIVEALAFFENELASKAGENGDRLKAIFDIVCQRLEFMCATLEAENAYNIFKSLNSTGVPLSASDLIRNFVFMHVLPDEQDEFDRHYWGPLESRFTARDGASLEEESFSRFFRDFLMADGRYVAPKDTFPEFEAQYEATDFSPKVLASDLLKASGQYEVICGKKPDKDAAVTEALAGLNVLESSTTYPLLLALFKLRDSGAIDPAGLAHAIQMLRGFILRRFICNESSRGYGRMFIRGLADKSQPPVESLEGFLLQRGWPDDGRFETSFVTFPLYSRGYKKEVIEALERGRGHKEPADLTDAQVEHTMPQTLSADWRADLGGAAEQVHAQWLDTPGNLTLSGYNQELWNHRFAKKKQRYAESNIVLTRELSHFETWGEAEIKGRGAALAKEAAAIWIGPKHPPQIATPENSAAEEQSRFEIRNKFWEGLSDYLLSDYPALPKIDARPVSTIRLHSSVRHIGIETGIGLRDGTVGIAIWFWREESMPVWQKLKAAPGKFDAIIGGKWIYEQIKDHARGRMTVELPVAHIRDPASWSSAYEWFGTKLAVIYNTIVPLLREEMEPAQGSAGSGHPDSDG